MSFNIRYAKRSDTELILEFIKALADYEQMGEQVIADVPTLSDWIFDKNKAEVLLAFEDETPVGFALYFYNFSTFLGRSGLYLEDLFVKPQFRGKGYGKALLARLANTAKALGCGRMEWWCLDWNKSSIDFYLSLNAEPMSDWTTYRLTGSTLDALAAQDK